MVKLSEILDVNLLQEHQANGMISKSVHENYPELTIYSYSKLAQVRSVWDSVTEQCRGLMTISQNGEEYVFGRGFNKFHNLNTSDIPETNFFNLPNEKPIISSKLDGSLGLIYWYDDNIWVATKGSFNSDQAKWATQFLRDHLTKFQINSFDHPNPDFTILVEIIYPENRIVVDYKGERNLYVLSVVDDATGKELPRREAEDAGHSLNLPVVQLFDKTIEQCMSENNNNEEGYILTFPSTSFKVKVKFEEYCRLHRIVTGLSARGIWQEIVNNHFKWIKLYEGVQTTNNLKKMIADTSLDKALRDWIKFTMNDITKQYRDKMKYCNTSYAKVFANIDISDKKKVSEYIAHYDAFTKAAVFALIDGQSIEEMVWESIYPAGGRGEVTYRNDGE